MTKIPVRIFNQKIANRMAGLIPLSLKNFNFRILYVESNSSNTNQPVRLTDITPITCDQSKRYKKLKRLNI